MRLRGLDPLALSLTLALVVGALLLLYLLRRPARRVIVPSLTLWQTLLPEQRRVTAILSPTRRLTSLALALLIAALLVFALGDPEQVHGGGARSVVVLLDRSTSMAAREGGSTRLELAKRRARALLDQLGAEDQALLISFADTSTPLTPFTGDRGALRRALDAVHDCAGPGDLLRATELALGLLAGRAQPELVLLSDGGHDDASRARQLLASHSRVRARHERVGSPASNLAITTFSVRRYPLDRAHQEILVGVENFGPRPEQLTLELRDAGRLLYQAPFQLAPHAQETRTLTDLPAVSARLEARIVPASGRDALALDDRAETRLPARPATRVLSVSSGNRFLEAALLLDEQLEVEEVPPESYRDARGFDVVIFDGVLPESAPGVPALYLGAQTGGASPLTRTGVLERPFFERVQDDHPLVRQLSLGDVNIAQAAALALGPDDLAIGATRDRKPLLVSGARDGVPFVLLAFALRESDLPLRPAWPLLLLRALDRLASPDQAASAQLAIARGLGARESDLALQAQVFPSASPAAEQARAAPWNARMWPLLALVALLLLALEWLTFHRRWTT